MEEERDPGPASGRPVYVPRSGHPSQRVKEDRFPMGFDVGCDAFFSALGHVSSRSARPIARSRVDCLERNPHPGISLVQDSPACIVDLLLSGGCKPGSDGGLVLFSLSPSPSLSFHFVDEPYFDHPPQSQVQHICTVWILLSLCKVQYLTRYQSRYSTAVDSRDVTVFLLFFSDVEGGTAV